MASRLTILISISNCEILITEQGNLEQSYKRIKGYTSLIIIFFALHFSIPVHIIISTPSSPLLLLLVQSLIYASVFFKSRMIPGSSCTYIRIILSNSQKCIYLYLLPGWGFFFYFSVQSTVLTISTGVVPIQKSIEGWLI